MAAARSERTPRTAFTLVELLAVVAIVAVLVGLLLPAVQSAREAARRTGCANNIRQLAIGLLGHQQSAGQFPKGLVCTTGSCDLSGSFDGKFAARHPDWGESFLIHILPYLEQQAIYDRYDFAEPNASRGNMEAVAAGISSLLCPSRASVTTYLQIHPTNSHRVRVSKIHYGGNYGAGRAISETVSWQPGLRGVFNAARQWGASSGHITDGTSTTLLLGEIIADSESNDSRGAWNYQAGTAFSGGLTSATPSPATIQAEMRGPNPVFSAENHRELADSTVMCPNKRSLSDTRYYCNDGSKGVAVRSTHPSGANVACVDGSTRFVTDAIDHLAWYAMHTIAGREVIGGE